MLRPCAALTAEEGVEGEEGVDGAAAVWVQTVLKDDDDDKGKGKGGESSAADKEEEGGALSKAASFLSMGGSASVGAAHHAVEAGDIVELMAKIMKVCGGACGRACVFVFIIRIDSGTTSGPMRLQTKYASKRCVCFHFYYY